MHSAVPRSLLSLFERSRYFRDKPLLQQAFLEACPVTPHSRVSLPYGFANTGSQPDQANRRGATIGGRPSLISRALCSSGDRWVVS